MRPLRTLKRFAKIYARGDKSITDAAIEAGYSSSSRAVAQVCGSKALAHPGVQELLNRELDRILGNPETRAAQTIDEILRDPDEKGSTKIQALNWLSKNRGWEQPKKTAILKADISNKFKLPEE